MTSALPEVAVKHTNIIVKQDVRKLGDATLVADASIVYGTVG